MDEFIKVNALYKTLLSRGHTDMTYLKVKAAVNGDVDRILTNEEAMIIKSLLKDINKLLTKTIKSL